MNGGIRSEEIWGAEIQYFRTDPRDWETIVRRFRDAGLRCVTSYVQWGTHAVAPPDRRHPAGILDFEGKTDPRRNLLRFLELVEKYGLNLNFRCGPFTCNEMVYGGYPPWIVLGDPDMMVWDYQNRTTPGYWVGRKEGSQPSYLHPRYLAHCQRWLGAVDRILVPHLKIRGGCVTMVSLDNEISYIVKDSLLDSDYNPVNARRGGLYHRFLRRKYGAASRIPYAPPRGRIEDIVPPRAVPATIGGDLAWYTDWIEFKTWVMCEYIRRLRRMHEENGVRGVVFTTNFNPHLPEGIPTRMPDFEAAAGGISGYDFYRGAFMSYSGYHSMARVLKLMNASLKFTWSAEFMAGTWNKILPSRVSDDHMRFMARCALAHGCKAIQWFMFHDRDCWGDAPVSSHGHPRPSLEVLRETVDLVGRRVRGWDALVPQADVAIVYDLLQHQHTAVGDPNPCDDNHLHVGAPRIDGVEAGRASQEYVGLFRLVEQAGAQAGVVDVMHSPQRLRNYPLVFLPGSPVIEEAAGRALRDYARKGGALVLSGPWPTRNQAGRPLKFLGLPRPDGDRPVESVRIGSGRLIWHRDYLAQEPPEEESLQSIHCVEALIRRHVSHVQALIRPAQAVAWVDWQPEGGHRLYRQPRNLGSAILHRNADETVLFVLNHYPEAVRFNVTLAPSIAARRLVNLITGETIAVTRRRATVDMDRKAAEIYRVE
jgi:beta-galactosidase